MYLLRVNEPRGWIHPLGWLKDHLRHEFEAVVFGAEAFGVVEFWDINEFFAAGDDFHGGIIVAAVAEGDHASMEAFVDEIESKITVSHGYDGIQGVRVPAAYEVA